MSISDMMRSCNSCIIVGHFKRLYQKKCNKQGGTRNKSIWVLNPFAAIILTYVFTRKLAICTEVCYTQ